MHKIYFAFITSMALIASCSQKASAPTATKDKVYDSARLFAKNCARCHGAEGIKDERTPNLQTIALDKAGLIKSITYGKDRMPDFEDKLSTEEISAIADLIVGWHK